MYKAERLFDRHLLDNDLHFLDSHQCDAALDEQARKDADDKAWADAEKTGTIAAYTALSAELRHRHPRIGGKPAQS